MSERIVEAKDTLLEAVWAGRGWSDLEDAEFLSRLVGAPVYKHVRRWRWWHQHFCASCRDAVVSWKAGRGDMGAKIHIPSLGKMKRA